MGAVRAHGVWRRSAASLGRVGLEAATHDLGATGCAVEAVVAGMAGLATRGVWLVKAARGAVVAAFETWVRVAEATRRTVLFSTGLGTARG